jgi:Restriction endonuclease
MAGVDWKQFERLVVAIHHAESQGGEVRWNDIINGRQFDVTIRFKYGIHDYLCVVECKNYSNKVPVDKVDAFVTKASDAKANKAVMVSFSGYQSGCVEVANLHGIRLLTLNEKIKQDILSLAKEITPALNIYSVRLVNSLSAQEYELEDVGGRLSYLMGHTIIRSDEGEKTPNQIVHEWQLARPEIDPNKENEVEIPLPTTAVAHIPYETTIPTAAIRFKCKLIEAIIPNRPVMDNHIMATLSTELELRDTEGNLQHASRLAGLQLGYDTKIEPGKFYVIPSLFNHYYCESIEDGLVSWVLVESYQYGQLLRARIKQDIQHSGHYVEVADERTLKRLWKLLDEFNGYKS